jgi:5S rRNA maturation endonuclease (ribonuclease M5)
VEGLKPRAARADQVYLATDPDREGEAIAWHLKETLQLKRYHRVTFDAITEDVIQKALKTPRQLDMNLVHAQEASSRRTFSAHSISSSRTPTPKSSVTGSAWPLPAGAFPGARQLVM